MENVNGKKELKAGTLEILKGGRGITAKKTIGVEVVKNDIENLGIDITAKIEVDEKMKPFLRRHRSRLK